jgi:hypothetical protein
MTTLYSNHFELKTMLAVVLRLFTGEVVVSSVFVLAQAIVKEY